MTVPAHPLPVILLFGPTGVGKTDLLLRHFSGKAEIVSADSMQVYRGLDIGTAKPDPSLLRILPHHLIDLREPNEQFNAGEFVRLAEEAVADIARRGLIPVISGGTAFYFRNFVFGLPESPPVDAALREQLKRELASSGGPALHEELRSVDPEYASRIPPNDLYRILRALEVYRATGRPLSGFAVPQTVRKDYRFLVLGLDRPREELYRRIERRVDKMIEAGLPAEIRRLVARGFDGSEPGLQGIGYREFFLMQRGGMTLRDTVAAIKTDTRHYAKRQLTFFRTLPDVHWYHPDEQTKLMDAVREFLQEE